MTVHPEQREQFENIMSGNCFASVGVVTEESVLAISGLNGDAVVTAGLAELKEAWQQTLREL